MKKILTAICILSVLSLQLFADISVTSYGGAESVSGSCFLLEGGAAGKVIIDCGLFMDDDGEKLSENNDNIDEKLVSSPFLVLTHAHLDHCGRIPLLVSKGFNGKIYSSDATKKLALSLFAEGYGFDLADKKWFWSQSRGSKARKNNSTVVAHWDEECKRNIKITESSKNPVSLKGLEKNTGLKFRVCKNCASKESEKMAVLFVPLEYGAENEISRQIKVKLIDAGHIPGSASVIVYAEGKKIIFSGDLGSGYSRFNGKFEIPEKADMVFMESTYSQEISGVSGFKDYDVFRDDLANAVQSEKIVWIPALSFNRTQKVLYELKLMKESGKLPENIPVFTVSPSANRITDLYQEELKKGKGDWFLQKIYEEGTILPEGTNFKTIKEFGYPAIVISSSGDMDKGMSEAIMPGLLPKKNLNIMIVNYVSPESPAGRLLKGNASVKGIKSGATIKKYDIFSDHPDFDMLREWLSAQDKNVLINIIHSDKESSAAMEELLKKYGWRNSSPVVLKQKLLLRN